MLAKFNVRDTAPLARRKHVIGVVTKTTEKLNDFGPFAPPEH